MGVGGCQLWGKEQHSLRAPEEGPPSSPPREPGPPKGSGLLLMEEGTRLLSWVMGGHTPHPQDPWLKSALGQIAGRLRRPGPQSPLLCHEGLPLQLTGRGRALSTWISRTLGAALSTPLRSPPSQISRGAVEPMLEPRASKPSSRDPRLQSPSPGNAGPGTRSRAWAAAGRV